MVIQGTAVRWHDKGILFLGKSGSGKSTAALTLMSQGAELVADDGLALDIFDDRLTAICPDSIKGKMEVRGVGVVDVLNIHQTALDLVIQCEADWSKVPRMPEIHTWEMLGLHIPMYQLCPFETTFSAKIDFLLKTL